MSAVNRTTKGGVRGSKRKPASKPNHVQKHARGPGRVKVPEHPVDNDGGVQNAGNAIEVINAKVRHVVVSEDEAGQRLDNYLLRELKGVPRSHIYRLLRKGEVRVNKGRVKPLYKLKAGDDIRVPPVRLASREAPDTTGAPDLEAQILFEDDRIIAINKPAGIAVHGGSGQQYGLIEALRVGRPDAHFLELVHRLDRDTSGILLIAKKRSALRNLHEQLRDNHKVSKHYRALLKGRWQGGERDVKFALRKETVRDRERFVLLDPQGQAAHSRFTPLEQFSGEGFNSAVLVNVQIFTGRTHQIRVHSKGCGNPVAGDGKYGDAGFNRSMDKLGLRRMFLHAARLEFSHPLDGRPMHIECPLPPELERPLTALRELGSA